MQDEKINRILELVRELLLTEPTGNMLNGILCQSELIILALSVSDEIDGRPFPATEAMIRHEVSSELKRIARSAMELQSVREDEVNDGHRKQLEEMRRAALRISGLLQLTGEFPPVPAPIPVLQTVNEPEPEGSIVPLRGAPPAVLEAAPHIAPQGQELQTLPEDEVLRRLREEIRLLREELAALISEKNNLELVECRQLQAVYTSEIEVLLTELYQKQFELRYVKRKIRLIRAALNRQEHVTVEAVEAQLEAEYKKFEARFEEFHKKVADAREYRKTHPDAFSDTEADEEERRSPDYMKKLYRKIVKAMHPDLHPDQTPEEAELFKKANTAYEDGDMDTLEMIWQIISGGSADSVESDNREILLKERSRLLELIVRIREEIEAIRTSFPYTMKDILTDPEKLARRQEEIRVRITETVVQLDLCRAELEELERTL